MQTFLFQSIKVIKCELIWSVEKICIVHSDFAVFSFCNGFEIFIFKFLFFEMMMDQTIYELAFWTIFFPYPKPQKIIGSRFNCCGNIDTRLSMCFMLSMILVSKVIWTHQIYCHWMVYRVRKRLANFKNYYMLFSCIFFIDQTCIT